jgi:hypothetical protein
MRSTHHTDPLPQDSRAIALQAEAYLAKLPDISGDDIKTMLADGMILVSSLLRGDMESLPERENRRKLAGLVLVKMQRITRETSLYGKQGAYPCFTS